MLFIVTGSFLLVLTVKFLKGVVERQSVDRFNANASRFGFFEDAWLMKKKSESTVRLNDYFYYSEILQKSMHSTVQV